MGLETCRQLAQEKCDFLVVDNDADTREVLKDRLPTEVIQPPTEDELMAQLGRPLTMRERSELGTPKSDEVVAVPAAWRRIAREAGVSHSAGRWQDALSILIEDYDAIDTATAEEIIDYVKGNGVKKAAQEVDVVTTGTFGPMCSSGAYFNVGHTKPRMKLGGGKCYLNDVPVYVGLAAVDFFLGATAMPEDDPRNKVFPGKFSYGGGHIIVARSVGSCEAREYLWRDATGSCRSGWSF